MQALTLRAMSLLGCALALSNCSPAPPVAVSGACPSLPVYDAALQTKAADEVAAMPAGSVVAEVLLPDYGSMRDAVRACMAARDAH